MERYEIERIERRIAEEKSYIQHYQLQIAKALEKIETYKQRLEEANQNDGTN